MKRRYKIIVSALGLAVLAALALYLSGWSLITIAGVVLNTIRSAHNPPGSLVLEVNGGSSATLVGVPNSNRSVAGSRESTV